MGFFNFCLKPEKHKNGNSDFDSMELHLIRKASVWPVFLHSQRSLSCKELVFSKFEIFLTVAFACPAWRSLPRLHLCWVIKAEVVISSKNHPVALEAGQETQIQREIIYETLWALRGQTVAFDLQRVTEWTDRRTKKFELAALLTWCRTVDSEMRFPLTKVLAFSIGMMLTVSCMLDITLKKKIK